jgi:hypothetical protein
LDYESMTEDVLYNAITTIINNSRWDCKHNNYYVIILSRFRNIFLFLNCFQIENFNGVYHSITLNWNHHINVNILNLLKPVCLNITVFKSYNNKIILN